jgi:Putative restriction endonuclease
MSERGSLAVSRTPDRVTKRRLYACYGVPFSRLVDPDARAIEVFVLERERYVLAAGAAAVDLPPFTALGLIPESLWP